MKEVEESMIGGELERLCSLYRGYIIDKIINIETFIDHYLILYYLSPRIPSEEVNEHTLKIAKSYQEKTSEFWHTVVEKENFNLMFKFNALKFLLEKYCTLADTKYPDYLEKTKKLIEKRNVWAHKKMDKGLSDAKSQQIVLTYRTTERGKKHLSKWEMNPNELSNFTDDYMFCVHAIDEAGKELIKKT